LRAIVLAIPITVASAAHGHPVTFGFAGIMGPAGFDLGADFSIGDTFVGYYTFESDTPDIGHPDPSLSAQYFDSITAWEVLFPTSGYRFIGATGSISVGNDTPFGDRYIATLHSPGSAGKALPSNRELSFVQFDLFDSLSDGADFLNDNSIQDTPPQLPLIGTSPSGLFLFTNNDQPDFTLTALYMVPEPAPRTLVLAGVAALVACWTGRGVRQRLLSSFSTRRSA